MSALSSDELDRLVTGLSGCYEDGQRGARMSPDALKIARDSGLFTMTVPPEPCTLPEVISTLRRVAAVEPGVSWAAMNCIVFGHVVARMSEKDRNALLVEVADGPFAFSGIPGGRATLAESAYKLDGSWPFLTAAEDCERAVLAGIVDTGAEPDFRVFLVDPADITVGTNWQGMAGLRTSGSHSAQVTGLHIREDLTVRLSDPPTLDAPLYRLPVFAYFFGTAVANFLGVFRGGLENAIDLITNKTSSVDGSAASSSPATQAAVGDAEAALRAYEAALDAVIAQMWEEVQQDGEVTIETRAACYRTLVYIVDSGREAISRLYGASTTLAWVADAPIQRAMTDMHAIAVTFERIRRLHFDGARFLLGLDPEDPTF